MNKMKHIRIAAIAVNNIEDIELIVPVDVWRRAGFTVDIISAESRNSFTLNKSILRVSCDKRLNDVNFTQYDAIFLPGGSGYEGFIAPPATKKTTSKPSSVEEPNLHLAIKKFYKDKNKYLLAICASPLVFQQIIEDEKFKTVKFTSYPFLSTLKKYEKTWLDKRVVVDKNVITGQAAGCSFELAFTFVEMMSGKVQANLVANEIGYPWETIKKLMESDGFPKPTVSIEDK